MRSLECGKNDPEVFRADRFEGNPRHFDRRRLTKSQRWRVADLLADERLARLNETLEEVKLSHTFYARYVKRILDIICALIAIIVTLPINIIIGIVTFISLGKPLFFKQQRAGMNGKLFTIIKFRNMRESRDERGELLPPEERVTRLGILLRKTSLDELLNFWCVLKGDMSIIGPRPLVPEYTHRYNKRHRMRLAVRPGLECPPRKLDNHVWTWQEQLDNDIWYVEHISFKTDCLMIINLVKFAFDKKSAQARATAQRGTFMGYDESGRAINLDGVPQQYIDWVVQVEEANG